MELFEKENVMKVLAESSNVLAFHYDVENSWDAGEIDFELWNSKFRDYSISSIDRMKNFLQTPYVEDAFGREDKARDEWMCYLSKFDGNMYNVLRDVNIFRISRLNGLCLQEHNLISCYEGSCLDSLAGYQKDLEMRMPGGGFSRMEYNEMDFYERMMHIKEIKKNVFGFLSCLVEESFCRREK